jgi:hypothetical protein
MKKILFSLILVISFGCSNEDDLSQITGNWKLMEAQFNGFQGESIIDYSNENITYTFLNNGTLVVDGNDNVGYEEGEYDYFFGEDFLGGNQDPKILLVKINNSKWTYSLSNGKMILGKSYVDGPDLVFERK